MGRHLRRQHASQISKKGTALTQPITFNVVPGAFYTFDFINHRQELRKRIVVARSLQWGATAWHPDLQWFLEGFDIEKQELRSFPLARIELGSFARYTDELADALLTKRVQAAYDKGLEIGKETAKDEAD